MIGGIPIGTKTPPKMASDVNSSGPEPTSAYEPITTAPMLAISISSMPSYSSGGPSNLTRPPAMSMPGPE